MNSANPRGKRKDVNLFAAFRESPDKSKAGGAGGLIVTALCFAAVVAAVYSGLVFYRIDIQRKTDDIRAEISTPDIVQFKAGVADQLKKNTLLKTYYTALSTAAGKLAESRLIDSGLMAGISEAIPGDFTAVEIRINPQGVTITGDFREKLSPAAFMQELLRREAFGFVKYNSITYEVGIYSVTMYCNFNDGGEAAE